MLTITLPFEPPATSTLSAEDLWDLAPDLGAALVSALLIDGVLPIPRDMTVDEALALVCRATRRHGPQKWHAQLYTWKGTNDLARVDLHLSGSKVDSCASCCAESRAQP